jgi:hypothetical protein
MLRNRIHAVKPICNFPAPDSLYSLQWEFKCNAGLSPAPCGQDARVTTFPAAPETGSTMAAFASAPSHSLEPVWSAQPDRWDFAAAAHLLRRAGFGGSTAETRQLVDLGPEKAVAGLVNYSAVKDDFHPIEFGELTSSLTMRKKEGGGAGPAMAGGAALYRELSPEQRKMLYQLSQGAQREKLSEMKMWWLDRMVRTPKPLEEKMTLFWHGLFVSNLTSVRNSALLYQQNELFRKSAVGNYKDLTLEVSKNPAMLIFLNNNDNKKEHPNENYARELMELFTMGIGNYTEKDIKESARAFTGWTNIGDQFAFNKRQHDIDPKTFLGKTGNFDGAQIIDIIFEQACTSKYIATRLLKFFAIDEPSEEIVAALAAVVKSNKFEIAPTLQTLFASQWFYSQEVMRRQIKSPVQLIVGTLRALGVGLSQPAQVDSALKLMGQELFMAPTVKGWDGGRSWINTSTLFARYNLPAYLGTGRLPAGGKVPTDAMAAGAGREQYADFNSGWSPQIDLAQAGASTTDAVVDLYIKKLLGAPLDPRKRDELIEFVNATGDAKSHLHDPIAAESDHRVRNLVHLIMSMAEYQLA